MIVQICIGSSCHLRGSQEIVELMRKAVADNGLEDDVILAGSFCIGKCTPTGVTVQADDDIVCGVNRDNFAEFFRTHILNVIKKEG